MRQVFTSPRIENVEGVARMLEGAGIEVRITHGRSYRGAIRGNFSYRDSERVGPQPAVWIVKSEDQPRAREMLREFGLLASTRAQPESYLSHTVHGRDPEGGADPRRKRAFRLKMGLLAVIAVAIGTGVLALRKAPRVQPATPGAAATAPVAQEEPGFIVATPPALAETLLRIELEAQAPALACVAIDGKDPPADLPERLAAQGRRVQPASACDPEAADVRFDITQYRTDGSGVGSVRMDMAYRASRGSGQAESRTLEVERTGDAWRILGLR